MPCVLIGTWCNRPCGRLQHLPGSGKPGITALGVGSAQKMTQPYITSSLCPVAHFCWHTTSQYLKRYLVEIWVCRQNICASKLMSSWAIRRWGHPRHPPANFTWTHDSRFTRRAMEMHTALWKMLAICYKHVTCAVNTIPWTCSTSRKKITWFCVSFKTTMVAERCSPFI